MNEEDVDAVRTVFARSGVNDAPPLGLDVAEVMRRGRRVRRRRRQWAIVTGSAATAGVVSVLAVALTGPSSAPHPPVEPGGRPPAVTMTTPPRPVGPHSAAPMPTPQPGQSTVPRPSAKSAPSAASDPASASAPGQPPDAVPAPENAPMPADRVR